MFKGFQNTSRNKGFNGFPALNFQMNNEAYGFSGCTFWLDAAYGLNTQTDLAAVSSWQSRIGGITFTQTTAANQPRFILSDANYNNKPSVESQSTNRFLDSINGITFSNSSTLLIVSKVNTAQIANIAIGTSANVGIFDGGTQAGYNGFGFANRGSTGAEMQGTSESLNSRIKIITSSLIIINGSSEVVTGSIISYRNLLRLFMGATDTSYTGSIAEILVFNYSMNINQCTQLSNNVNTKYAIY